MLRLLDTHAHVQFPAFDQDREEVIARAQGAGIDMIVVGTQYSTSKDAVELARKHDGLWATVGFHPNHVDIEAHHDPWELREKTQETFDYQKFLSLTRYPKVVAIGECGLDYAVFVRKRSERGQKRAPAEASGEGGLPPKEIDHMKIKQKEIFIKHIELARKVQKPLMIHCRSAFQDLIKILNSYSLIHNSGSNGVVHFFTGSSEDAKKLLELGFNISFSGVITFAEEYEGVVGEVPLERMLVETDAPYAAPAPYRGKRNEPAYVVETAKKIAKIKGLDYEEVAMVTIENAKRLFGI